MKYYSEITKQLYDCEAALNKAEQAIAEKQAKEAAEQKAKSELRTARAKEVEKAYKAAVDANKAYVELRNAFVKDFGSFHMSVTSQSPTDATSLLDFLFNL